MERKGNEAQREKKGKLERVRVDRNRGKRERFGHGKAEKKGGTEGER